MTSFCKVYINKVFFHLLKYLRGNCSNLVLIVNSYRQKNKFWFVTWAIRNFHDYFSLLGEFFWQLEDHNKHRIIFYVFSFFEGTSFENNEINFQSSFKKFLFLFITRIFGDCLCLVETYYILRRDMVLVVIVLHSAITILWFDFFNNLQNCCAELISTKLFGDLL